MFLYLNTSQLWNKYKLEICVQKGVCCIIYYKIHISECTTLCFLSALLAHTLLGKFLQSLSSQPVVTPLLLVGQVDRTLVLIEGARRVPLQDMEIKAATSSSWCFLEAKWIMIIPNNINNNSCSPYFYLL